MKKIMLVLCLIVIIYFYGNLQKDEVIIPKESIRFRIIPNSNSVKDIAIKEKVKTNVERDLTKLADKDISKTRNNIINNKEKIAQTVNNTFIENNYNKKFNVKYGLNYFPEKEYKGVKYESGKYESLVIEIGEAKGDNFWCVLFPPLCMMDEADAEAENDKDYKFFVSEIINKYF